MLMMMIRGVICLYILEMQFIGPSYENNRSRRVFEMIKMLLRTNIEPELRVTNSATAETQFLHYCRSPPIQYCSRGRSEVVRLSAEGMSIKSGNEVKCRPAELPPIEVTFIFCFFQRIPASQLLKGLIGRWAGGASMKEHVQGCHKIFIIMFEESLRNQAMASKSPLRGNFISIIMWLPPNVSSIAVIIIFLSSPCRCCCHHLCYCDLYMVGHTIERRQDRHHRQFYDGGDNSVGKVKEGGECCLRIAE